MDERKRNTDFYGCWVLLTVGLIIVGALVVMSIPAMRIIVTGVPHGQAIARAKAYQIAAALQQYRAEYGTFPTGDRAHILAVLRGDNAGKIVLLDLPDSALNAQGEVVDPWDTPYQIEVTTGDEPRVWSYGANRRDEHGAKGSDDATSWR